MGQTVEDRRETEAVLNSRQRLANMAAASGKNHSEYAAELNQLALLLILQGDTDAAEPILREALSIRREVLGPLHPDYATNLSSIGGLLWARGDLDEAEPLFREAVEIRSATLGPNHPKSLISHNSLEQVLRAKKERGDAAPASKPLSVPSLVGTSPVPKPQDRPAARPVEPAVFLPPPSVPSLTISAPPPNLRPIPSPILTDPSPSSPLEALNHLYDQVGHDFAQLAALAEVAAEALKNPGLPPDEFLIAAWSAAGQKFARLVKDARAFSQDARIPCEEGYPATLAEVDATIARIEASESDRQVYRTLVDQAKLVLDQAERIRCPSDPTFAPVAACHVRIHAIRQSMESSPTDEIREDVRRLAEGIHPIAMLVKFVDADETTGDAIWADWYDGVERGLGHALAVAGARTKLVRDRV